MKRCAVLLALLASTARAYQGGSLKAHTHDGTAGSGGALSNAVANNNFYLSSGTFWLQGSSPVAQINLEGVVLATASAGLYVSTLTVANTATISTISLTGQIKFPDATTLASAPSTGTAIYITSAIFLTSGNWTRPTDVSTIAVCIVGGGASGGIADSGVNGDVGGGGGGGGVLSEYIDVSGTNTLVITIGAGGTGHAAGNVGNAGGTTSVGSIQVGGGAGGDYGGSTLARQAPSAAANGGGGGGGGGYVQAASAGGGGAGGPGGDAMFPTQRTGGKGGAYGFPGGDATDVIISTPISYAAGGAGARCSLIDGIFNSSNTVIYGEGGDGSIYNPSGCTARPDNPNGGTGLCTSNGSATNQSSSAAANSGGGGAGAPSSTGNGAGGSGFVAIAWLRKS